MAVCLGVKTKDKCGSKLDQQLSSKSLLLEEQVQNPSLKQKDITATVSKRHRVTIQALSTTSASLPSSSSCHEHSGIALIHPTFIFLSLNCLSLSKYGRSVYQ